jgi:heme-degrading monooxygenase HmoA
MNAETKLITLPQPPCIAVIFTSKLAMDATGYAAMAERMESLASEQDGFWGLESARSADRVGITVSYWRDEAAVRAWKNVSEHRDAQVTGKQKWYEDYSVRIARVERAY